MKVRYNNGFKYREERESSVYLKSDLFSYDYFKFYVGVNYTVIYLGHNRPILRDSEGR